MFSNKKVFANRFRGLVFQLLYWCILVQYHASWLSGESFATISKSWNGFVLVVVVSGFYKQGCVVERETSTGCWLALFESWVPKKWYFINVLSFSIVQYSILFPFKLVTVSDCAGIHNFETKHVGLSIQGVTPKFNILLVFSIIDHQFGDTPLKKMEIITFVSGSISLPLSSPESPRVRA